MRMTQDEVDLYLTRYNSLVKQAHGYDDVPDDGPESRLAGRISKWAKDKGYPILNLRQSKKAKGFIPTGWPDVTLVLPGGRVLFIELKSAAGRLRAEQNHMALRFAYLKSGICVIRSFNKFLEVVDETKA